MCTPEELSSRLVSVQQRKEAVRALSQYRFIPSYASRGLLLRAYTIGDKPASEQPYRYYSAQSIGEYYERYRKIKLKYGELPCVGLKTAGGRIFLIPPELLIAVGKQQEDEHQSTRSE